MLTGRKPAGPELWAACSDLEELEAPGGGAQHGWALSPAGVGFEWQGSWQARLPVSASDLTCRADLTCVVVAALSSQGPRRGDGQSSTVTEQSKTLTAP